MANARYVVRVPDLENGPQLLRSPIPTDWLDSILADTDVKSAGEEGRVSVSITKSDADVLVRGHLEVTIQVPCARTLDPAVYRLKPEVFLLLSPARRVPHAKATTRSASSKKKRPERPEKPSKTKGRGAWEEDPELSGDEAALDTYNGEEVTLDNFFREFILLEVPMVPLREDLRDESFAARPPHPGGQEVAGSGGAQVPSLTGVDSGPTERGSEPKPLDPRLSPLASLKARLEKKE